MYVIRKYDSIYVCMYLVRGVRLGRNGSEDLNLSYVGIVIVSRAEQYWKA